MPSPPWSALLDHLIVGDGAESREYYDSVRKAAAKQAQRPEVQMPVSFESLKNKAYVYIDYPFENARFRVEKKTGKVYSKFPGKTEKEIRPDSDIYNQAILWGEEITREEYQADFPPT
jgi:hypothetical protein